jgi:hypothetical protein
MGESKVHHTDDELEEIKQRQLERIRRGESMLTVMQLPIGDRVKVERQWKEGGGAPCRLRDVAI